MPTPTEAWTTLRRAMIDADPACLGDDRFTSDHSALSDLAPICRRCPLLGPCSDLAQTARALPVWGILGASDRRGDRSTALMNAKAASRLIGA